MARPKKEYDPKTGKIIENLSACIGNMDLVSEILPDISRRDLKINGIYRSEWQRGKALGKYKVQSTYMKMATSGKCWPATKHFLASQCGIIEPKEAEPDTDDITTARPDVMIRFVGKPIEVEPNENITESTDR